MKLLFVVTGVPVGGAENMLLKLITGLPASYQASVIALEPAIGGLSQQYHDAGIQLRSLEMGGLRSVPVGVARLARVIRRERPDVVCTWLYHADLIGTLACLIAGHRTLAWNIRNSDLDPKRTPLARRAVVRADALLSRIPRQILCCSEVARDIHIALGYAPDRFHIVPNGFDLSAFRPDPEARNSVRAEFGISDNAPLVGMIARFDPQKDHETFVNAAARLHRRLPDSRFLLIGPGCDRSNGKLNRWVQAAGLSQRLILAGHRTDIPRLTAALDVSTLTSTYGEAFPNVLGEAMACGVPCVTTPIGDSAQIVGDTGIVASPGNAREISEAWLTLLQMPANERANLGRRARARVAEHYELERVRQQYVKAFEQLVT